MADEKRGASFLLALIDRITAPARRMRESIRGLESAQKAATAANAATAKAMAATGLAADAAARKVNALATAHARAATSARGAAGFLGRMGAMQGPALPAAIANMRGSGAWQGPIQQSSAGRFMQKMGAVHGPVFDPAQAGQAPMGEMFGPRRATAIERIRSQVVGLGKDFMSWNDAVVDQNKSLSDLFGKLSAGPLGAVGRGIKGIAGAAFDLSSELLSAALSAGKLVLALGAIAAGMFVKRILELSNFAQKSRTALAALSHSTEQGAAQFAQARRIAGELGTSVEDVTHQFIELRAAQFTPEQTESILKLSRDLQALTGDAEGASRAVRAITQIKAKGRVQAEELLQLSEAGLSLELVYEQLMKSTGLGRDALRKQLQTGKIDAVKGVDAIQKAIMAKLHEQKAGDFAKEVSNKTLGGAWERLKSMPDVFMLDIAESVNTAKLVAGMRVITQAFEAGGKSKLQQFAQRSIDLLGELVPLVVDFGEGFMSAFDGILEGMSQLDTKGLKEMARTAGEYLGKFFGEALKFANAALPILKDSLSKFFEAIDWEALTKAFLQIDWGKLAQDLLTIAGALMKISMTTVQGTSFAVQSLQQGQKSPEQLAATGGGDLAKSIAFNSMLLGGTGAVAGSIIPGVGTLAGGIGGAALGVPAGIWDYLMDENAASLAAKQAADSAQTSAVGPQASLRSGIQANNFRTEVHITAPPDADAKKLAAIARDEVVKGLRGLTGELSESVPA